MANSIRFDTAEPGIGLLTIQRPHVRNALDWEAMHTFAEAIEKAHASPGLRVLILTGDERAFCAGGDLVELHEYPSRQDGERLARLMGEALNRLDALPIPTMAAIEGAAIGGGAEIAIACDLRIAAADARIGWAHVRLGICPAWGGSARLLEAVGYARALEWQLTGRTLSGEEAYQLGLVDHRADPGEALKTALQLAAEIAAHDRAAVIAIKRILRTARERSLSEAARLERRLFPLLWAATAHLEVSQRFMQAKGKSK